MENSLRFNVMSAGGERGAGWGVNIQQSDVLMTKMMKELQIAIIDINGVYWLDVTYLFSQFIDIINF